MISEWKSNRVHEDYKKYMNEIDYERVKGDEWHVSKFHVLNAMISIKNGLLPFLDANGYKSDNLLSYYDRKEKDRKNVLECKHYELYRYDYKDLDVVIHNRGDHMQVYVIYDVFKNKEMKSTIFDERTYFTTSRFGYFGSKNEYNHNLNWETLYDKNKNYTNLTFEEFAEKGKELNGYNFIAFDIDFDCNKLGKYYQKHLDLKKFIINGEFKGLVENDITMAIEEFQKRYDDVINTIDRFSDDSVQRAEWFKIYLDNCLKVIDEKREYPMYDNSASTNNYDYEWEYLFETIPQIDLSHERCELGSNWNMSLFDINVDFLYTKEEE